jgi:hypothetical protein
MLPISGLMTAFMQRSSGTMLVGSSNGASLRSTDGGHTFAPWPNGPHVRALAERGQTLYAVGSDYKDSFAMGRSDDEGAHWTPLLHFRDIVGPLPCGNIPSVCAGPFATVMQLFNPGPPQDGGTTESMDLSAWVPPPPPGHTPSGCGCALGDSAAGGARAPELACLLLVVAALRGARTRRSR